MKTTKKIIAALALMTIVSGTVGALSLQQAQADGTTSFAMLEGASIRLAETTGLRFQVELGSQQYSEVTDDTKNVELGMLILPEPYVTAYETAKASNENLTYHDYFETENKIVWDKVIEDEKIFVKSDLKESEQADYYREGYYYASGVISEVLFNNYNRNFVAVAYTKTTAADNTVSYTYTDKSLARSVAYVAGAAYEKKDWGSYESTVQGFIENATYNLAGVKQDSETEKYTYNAMSYDTLSAAKEAAGEITMSITAKDVMLTGKMQTATSALKVGETEINSSIAYSVADNTIATVEENGLVTAQDKNGTTNVKASAFGGMYSAETVVTVSDGNIFTESEGDLSARVGTMSQNSDASTNNFGAMKNLNYWNEEEQAYVFYKYSLGRDRSAGCVRYSLYSDTDYTASSALKALLDAETSYVKFDVKVNQIFMDTTSTNSSQIKVQLHWAQDTNGTNGGYSHNIHKSVFSAGEYVTVGVDVSGMLTAYKEGEANYLWFFLGGQKGSEICLKNFAPITEEEYYAINGLFYQPWADNAYKYTTADSTGATVSAGKLSNAWDDTEGAYTIYKKAGTSDNNDFIRFYNTEHATYTTSTAVAAFLKALNATKTSSNAAYVKFDLKVDAKYMENPKNTTKIQLLGYTNGLDTTVTGIKEMSTSIYPTAVATADEWTTVYFDMTKLLNHYNYEGGINVASFQFRIWGNTGAKVSLKNMRIATESEYTAWAVNNVKPA